jgi:hypothetical protein
MLFKSEVSSLDHYIFNKLIFCKLLGMKKDFVVSKIESSQDSSQYVLVAFTDPNEPKSAGGFDKSGEAIPFTSPEDLMKNLPNIMSNMFDASGWMSRGSPTFKISMKEYEEMAIKIGYKVGIEINKVDSSGI